MGRFSFSPPEHNLEEVVERSSWQKYRKDAPVAASSIDERDDAFIDSETTSSEDDEYPHPLGFPSYGRTRFFVDPPTESAQKVRRRLGFLKDTEDDFLVETNTPDETTSCPVQTFPPLSCYTDPRTAPTSALLSYSYSHERPQQQRQQPQQEEDPSEGVTQLLQGARLVHADQSPQVTELLYETQQVRQRLLQMSKTTQRDLRSARQDAQLKQEQLEKEQKETREAFRLLLQRDQQAAAQVLKQQEAQQRAREEAEQAKREQEEKEKAERQRIADEQEKKEQAKQQRAAEAAKKRDEEQKAAAQEEAKKTEYLVKAQKRVAQLVELRASVAPFEKSKNVSKRRLRMKKTVKGKVNTLSQDANKIQAVANEVTQEIQLARQEDEELKQQIKSGNRGTISEEMIRGKRYLIDLLASDAMVRSQAEGFNGIRGDGFPLANMLAIVSMQAKELVPILAAHIFTVCPTAIPTLPKVSKNESENELMESLGMAKGKDGEFETFDRFLARTEGLISLMAEIMASNPPDHVLMGGHKGAIEWLERFLGLLPPSPETMPLLTAPVLDAFLTGAGHMLADKYSEEFRKHLDVITKDIVTRLDEGPIGAPSALRLKKLVKGGFDFFKFEVPSKAIPSLYNAGAYGSLPISTGHGQSPGTAAQASFGGGQQGSSGPFASAGSGTSSSNAFGAASSSSGTGASPFGQQASGTGTQSASGGVGSQNQVATQSGFGSGAQSSTTPPFGQQSSGPSPFSSQTQQPSSSSFGQPTQSATQPATSFGGGFGQQSSQPSSFGASPFGQQSISTSGFGSQNQSTMQTSSAFGAPTTNTGFGANMQTSSAASPFGQSAGVSAFGGQNQPTMQQTSPFGPQPSKSPFGSTNTPFGAPAGQNSGTFGNSSTSTPFGAPSTPSPFGAPSTISPFGTSSTTAPFGTSTSQSFGTSSTTTPFGSSASQSSPFGSSNQNAIFGGNQSNSTGGQQPQSGGAFGTQSGGSGKPLCKFFAQGRCRFGNNCRFSHETPVGGGGGGGVFGGSAGNTPFSTGYNSPFGGPRR